jgi:ABC-2 type transport system ATP-binding protein
MQAVSVKGLNKTFGSGKNEVKALKDVSLDIAEGEIIGLLGPNGAGKTTFISILTGLLEKDNGSVNVLGLDLDKDLEKIKGGIGVVSGFSMVSIDLTVTEFLRFFGMLYGVKNLEKRIVEVMKLVGIFERKDEISKDLSSGFKQRLVIAKSLLNSPKVLFLDEPTVGLDVEIAVKVRELILELKKQGTTILLTSHNLYEVEQLCDRIALINEGKIIALGTIKDIKGMLRLSTKIIVVCDDAKKASSFIAKMKEIRKIEMKGNTLHIELEGRDTRKILNALIDAKVGLESFSLVEPSLEDAFIQLVKKR